MPISMTSDPIDLEAGDYGHAVDFAGSRVSRPSTIFPDFRKRPKAAAKRVIMSGSRPEPTTPLMPEVEIISLFCNSLSLGE